MIELLPQHRVLIEGSAISPMVAAARPYWSATKKTELRELGFGGAQLLAPALVIPVHGVTGELVTYQIRPDRPRVKDGKPLKYETPAGTKMALDVPPAVRDQLGDPAIPLYITEGARKADAAVSAGLCCIALLGVWNWRGTNDRGGKMALPDWESVALNGRTVFLAFDSDVTIKPEVAAALKRLKGFLESRKAAVKVIYLPHPEGGKVGLDDWLAAGHQVAQLEDLAEEHVRTLQPSGLHATVQPQVQRPALANTKRLLEAVATVLQPRIAGEVKLVKLVYLATTSRLLGGIPASVAIKGPSAAGKSSLLEKVLSLFPPDAVHVLTAMSEHSLAYGDEPLAHRMLVIYEAAMLGGGGGAVDYSKAHFMDYLLRSLLSEGRIRYETVEKNEQGQLVTRLIEREGPTGLLTTTTATSLHPENETRLLSLTVDDSKQQTAAVMLIQAGAANGEQPATIDVEPWHELQTWLQAQAPQAITIPYSKKLAELIPPLAVRLRRDFPMLLTLIQTHALLHQVHRERDSGGRIVAALDDYEVVRPLVNDMMADGVSATVSATVRATVRATAEVLAGKDPDATVNVQQVAAKLDLDKSAAYRRVQICIREGYLVNLEDRRGRPARLTLGAPLPDDEVLLPTVEDVSGCTVARSPEGDSARACVPTEEPDSEPDPPGESLPEPMAKRCPDGKQCSLTEPTGSPFCCGQPEPDDADEDEIPMET